MSTKIVLWVRSGDIVAAGRAWLEALPLAAVRHEFEVNVFRRHEK